MEQSSSLCRKATSAKTQRLKQEKAASAPVHQKSLQTGDFSDAIITDDSDAKNCFAYDTRFSSTYSYTHNPLFIS